MQSLTELANKVPARWAAAFLVVAVVVLAYKAAVGFVYQLNSTGHLKRPFQVVRRILRWSTVIIAALLVLQTLGFLQHAWTMLTATVTLVAVGFVAMWSVLSHALCAFILMFSGPFEIGDTIEFAEDETIRGEVVDFSLLFTFLETEAGHQIQVPNNMFFQKIVHVEASDSPTEPLDTALDGERDETMSGV